MFVFSEELIDYIEENTDYSVNIDNESNEVEFSRYSSAGQDFRFMISLEGFEYIGDLLRAIYEYYQNYDVSEETALWIDEFGHGKNGAPYKLEDVLDDMKECEKSIDELYDVINDFENPKKCYANPDYKDYYVTMKVTGEFTVKVAADSVERALKEAEEKFTNADFGELSEIEFANKYIEDEDENRVWEDN